MESYHIYYDFLCHERKLVMRDQHMVLSGTQLFNLLLMHAGAINHPSFFYLFIFYPIIIFHKRVHMYTLTKWKS